MEKKIKSQSKIEKDRMETEDHLRKEDEAGRADVTTLKGWVPLKLKCFLSWKVLYTWLPPLG